MQRGAEIAVERRGAAERYPMGRAASGGSKAFFSVLTRVSGGMNMIGILA